MEQNVPARDRGHVGYTECQTRLVKWIGSATGRNCARACLPGYHAFDLQTQPQTRALPGGFGGEERLEDFLADVFRDAIAVVLHLDDDLVTRFLGRNGDSGLVCGML